MQYWLTQARRSADREGASGPQADKACKHTADGLLAQLRRRRQEHRNRGRAYRVVFAMLGTLVLAAGLAMIVLPGPAFVAVPVGLAMLALEFSWADRMLHRIAGQAERGRLPRWVVVGAVVIAAGVGMTSAVFAI